MQAAVEEDFSGRRGGGRAKKGRNAEDWWHFGRKGRGFPAYKAFCHTFILSDDKSRKGYVLYDIQNFCSELSHMLWIYKKYMGQF